MRRHIVTAPIRSPQLICNFELAVKNPQTVYVIRRHIRKAAAEKRRAEIRRILEEVAFASEI